MGSRRTLVLRAAQLGDLPAAADLLARARTVHDGQLLGSGTALPSAESEIVAALAYATRAGSLDLALQGSRVAGVACWITHMARRRPSRQRQLRHQLGASVLTALLGRLELFDDVFRVEVGATHHHLAYLGTRPGADARSVAELLLDRRCRVADRDGEALYLEAPDGIDLTGIGFTGLGGSRTWAAVAPQLDRPCSVAMGRPAHRPSPATPIPASWPTDSSAG